jgi:tetratricopeptide (TPR) repeat protein
VLRGSAEAEREYLRALELNPNYATAHQWYGELLCGLKQYDEADREMKRAVSLDPLSPIMQSDVGMLLYYKRDSMPPSRTCKRRFRAFLISRLLSRS